MKKSITDTNQPKKWYEIDWEDNFRSLLWAIIIALVFRTFLFEPFRIPSGSMIPNLQIGDFLFTSKFPYGYSKFSFPIEFPIIDGRVMQEHPNRGDIIVFRGAKDPDNFYIKRLIGLPGDEIQVINGAIYINNAPLTRKPFGEYTRIGELGQHKKYDQYLETLPNGVSYITLADANINHHTFPDTTAVYKVPEKHYFFMGDNRNDSIDSRFLDYIGFIPEENLVGRADFMAWTEDFSIKNFVVNQDSGRALRLIK
jgi:signal peptidase I